MSLAYYNLASFFKLPIQYRNATFKLPKTIATDLELINTIDESCVPIYNYYFNNTNDISRKINSLISNYYTTDTLFLKDTQQILKQHKALEADYTDYSPNYEKVIDIWRELTDKSGFKEKYHFIEWESLEFLNHSAPFLQILSLYNLLSPLLSVLVPIIMLIIPFIIINAKGMSVTINEYINVLKVVANQNAIGKLFVTNFSRTKPQEIIYIVAYAIFYVFSIYQSAMTCFNFNRKMRTIYSYFNEIVIYIQHTTNRIENFIKCSNGLQTYSEFIIALKSNLNTLLSLLSDIREYINYNLLNVNITSEFGCVLKQLYKLHTDISYSDAIMFSLGFNGYMDCIQGLQENIHNNKVNFANFINKSNNTKFKNSYYANLKDLNPIKNTVCLKNNMIITGPNASGKTTILKSTLINVILTQQFGCGFYDSANIKPFDYIHCYLNIPDTSGRDSLFQAEARQCKAIIDIINSNKQSNHLCILDELYSGTNPKEAETSASNFMKYLSKYKNVKCLLTTHFTNICKTLKNINNIVNYKMLTNILDNGELEYTYIMKKGVSTIKGGVVVLKQLNYPVELLNT